MANEELTVRDYLLLARTFAWVANEGIYHSANSTNMPLLKPRQAMLAMAITALDDVGCESSMDEVLDQAPRSVGLPPNPVLKKLAAIILQWKDTGAVTIGESSFSCEAAK
jgi:hypothetical protein